MWDTLFILSLAYPALGKMSGFIVGGKQASINDWPFIAYLYIYNVTEQIASCGGSLISSQTVLTAAHCLDDITKKKKDFGEVSYDVLMGHVNHNKAIMHRTVIDYRTHEKYDPDGTMHDIGVMIVTHPVDFHRTVKKVVLMTPQMAQHMDNGDLVVAGWGRTGEDEPGSVMLKELKQTLLDKQLCYSYINDEKDPGIICGGRVNDSEYAYSGDSGGPLAQKRNQYLAGLVSWRIESHGFTIYTSVPYYYSWIETTQKTMYHEQCSRSRRNIRKNYP